MRNASSVATANPILKLYSEHKVWLKYLHRPATHNSP